MKFPLMKDWITPWYECRQLVESERIDGDNTELPSSWKLISQGLKFPAKLFIECLTKNVQCWGMGQWSVVKAERFMQPDEQYLIFGHISAVHFSDIFLWYWSEFEVNCHEESHILE